MRDISVGREGERNICVITTKTPLYSEGYKLSSLSPGHFYSQI